VDVTNIEPVDVEKVAAENPQSRFRIVENANLKPGVCALCGSAGGDGRQFIDFGKTMEWYGVVYFCTFCVGEAAHLLGLGNVLTLKEMLSDQSERYQTALYENAELQEQLNAARILLRNCHCGDDVAVPVGDVVDVEAIEEPESDDPDSDEPGGGEGSDDIPESPADDESNPPKRSSRARKSTE
jgi:hypothetical protein